ncbi:MAG: Ig-like domain-containing protein [Lachnospiraceae bacterium]
MKNGKKKGHSLISLLLALTLCLTAVPAQIVQAATTPVRVHPQKLTLNEGFTSRLMITGTKSKVTYSSSDKTVATVDSEGWITGVGGGDCVITAKYGSKKKTCDVTVIAKQTTNTGGSTTITAPEPQDGMGPQPDVKFLAPELTTLYIKEIVVKNAYVVPDKNMIVVHLENPNPGFASTTLTVNYTDMDGKSQTMQCHVMLIGGGAELFYEIAVFAKKGTAVTATASDTLILKNNFAMERHQIRYTPLPSKDAGLMYWELRNESTVDLDYVQFGLLYYTDKEKQSIGYDSFGITDFKAGTKQVITLRVPIDSIYDYNANVNYAYAGLPD